MENWYQINYPDTIWVNPEYINQLALALNECLAYLLDQGEFCDLNERQGEAFLQASLSTFVTSGISPTSIEVVKEFIDAQFKVIES